MSYLTDEPLSPEEERFIKQSERQFNYQNIPQPADTIPITATLNKARSDYGADDFKRIYHDYLKVQVPTSGQYLINQRTYDHLLLNIKARFQHKPHNDLLVCDSIVIVPIPNKRCSIYYYPHGTKEGEQIEMELIGSFVCDNNLRKLPVSCPYTDSFFGPDRKVLFNWYGNDKYGKIIPKTIECPDLELKYSNTSYPFLSPNNRGSFLITGICDTIAFNVTFNADANWNYRFGRQYNRKPKPKPIRRYHVKRRIIPGNNPGDIGWEIPSQDIEEDPNAPDPLLEIFQ